MRNLAIVGYGKMGRLIEQLAAEYEFTVALKLDEFNKSIFKPERFWQQVDELAAAIRPAVQEESEEKLARFDRVTAGEPVSPAGFGGGFGGPAREGNVLRPREGGEGPRPGGPGGFFQPTEPIKGFVKARAQSVIAQEQLFDMLADNTRQRLYIANSWNEL